MNRALRDAPPTPAGGERHKLGVISGLSALSLDAMASVAYGPEAIVIVLALAGGAGLGFTLPVTISIAVLLGVLAFSYRQVIAAFPEGGGAYGVSKKYLGRRASLVAAASLVIDYVLNVAVSVAAGVAALTSAFPELLPYTVWVCLGVLAVITAINYGGIARSAQWFVAPTVIYVVSIIGVVVVGLFRTEPAVVEHAAAQAQTIETVGVLLLLKAFANGCAALTGVEAIANAVPSFKRPAVRRAQRAEVALAGLLAVMLIGIATLIEKFSIQPVQGVTVLSQVTEASLGDGIGYYVVQFATVVLLALAANTSFGGLPVLASLLARDNFLPHLFALRAEKQVYRYGIGFLAVTSAVLLLAANGNMNTLVPLFAIGVFVGFTLSQGGMVRHWLRERSQGWRWKLALNGTGAILTGVAAIVLTVTKFTEGGWLIVVLLPLIAVLMSGVNRAYTRIGASLGVDRVPAQPHAEPDGGRGSDRGGERPQQRSRLDRARARGPRDRRAGHRTRRRRGEPRIRRGVGALEPPGGARGPRRSAAPHRGADRRVRRRHRGRARDRAHRRGRAGPRLAADPAEPARRCDRARAPPAARRDREPAPLPDRLDLGGARRQRRERCGTGARRSRRS